MKVLLLASYCEPGSGCTDDLPCLDCLQSCNVATMRGQPTDILGGRQYNRHLAATGLPREQAIEKLRDEAVKVIAGRSRNA